MKLYLSKPSDNQDIYESFISILLESIKRSYYNKIDVDKYSKYINKFYEKFIPGVRKPITSYIVNYITDSIIIVDSLSYKIVMINPHIYLPNSRVKVDSLVRFLEYGDEELRPLQYLLRVFRSYSDIYSDSWNTYKSKFTNSGRGSNYRSKNSIKGI